MKPQRAREHAMRANAKRRLCAGAARDLASVWSYIWLRLSDSVTPLAACTHATHSRLKSHRCYSQRLTSTLSVPTGRQSTCLHSLLSFFVFLSVSLEVTVTSLHPTRLCRVAVFSIKPTFSLSVRQHRESGGLTLQCTHVLSRRVPLCSLLIQTTVLSLQFSLLPRTTHNALLHRVLYSLHEVLECTQHSVHSKSYALDCTQH